MTNHLPQALERLLERHLIPHASLIVGVDTAGITEAVTALRTGLSIHPTDVLTVTDTPTIQELRVILGRIQLRPYQSERTLLAIAGFDTWNESLATVLLKTLEEPPTHCTIVLFATHESAILPTILSRVARFRSPRARQDSPVAARLSQESLSARLDQTKALAATGDEVSGVLQQWLVGQTDPRQQATILSWITDVASHPVNKRLALDALVLQLSAVSEVRHGA